MSETAKLVSFGRGGDTVHYSRGSTCSGYGSPEKPHAADGKDIPDGCPAIDKRPAVDRGTGVAMAINGPMVNVDLAPGQCDRMGDTPGSIVAQTVMSDPGNAFGAIARAQECARDRGIKYGPLDYVDTQTYIDLWRAAGARIGHYHGGIIVWETTGA